MNENKETTMTPVTDIIENAEHSASNRADVGPVPDGFAELIERLAEISAEVLGGSTLNHIDALWFSIGPIEDGDATHVCVGVDGAVTVQVIDAIGGMPVQHEPVVGCLTLPAGWGCGLDVGNPDGALAVWREFVEGGAS